MYLLNLAKQKLANAQQRAQMAEARAAYKGKVTKVAASASGKHEPKTIDVKALPKELRDKYFK